MATTRLMPLHAGAGRAVSDALGRSTDYIKNPDKTGAGEWISAYECDPISVDAEFLFSKREYAKLTGRDQGNHDVIAYHLRQSLKPGETDPATANKIGYDLAMSLTKGRHAFIVCTHVDKHHIHSHIIFNSTSLDHDRKFRNFWNSTFAVRKISDRLCLENGLSVIENPKPSRGSYGTWLGDQKAPSKRDGLRDLIDAALRESKSFDAFIAAMKTSGCDVKTGKHLAFKAPGQQRFVRCDSLGEDYSESAIRERISGKRIVTPKQKAVATVASAVPEKPNLLIDIQNNIKALSSPAYAQKLKVINIQEMAKTLLFLQERGLTDYDVLSEKAAAASKQFGATGDRIKAIEKRLPEIAALQKHIGAYSKTRDIYKQYRESGWSKKFFAAHQSDIETHRAAKKYFDSLGLAKLPTIKTLQQEYAMLDAEKKKKYQNYKPERENMIAMLTAKHNVDRILNITPPQKTHQKSGPEL